MRLRFCLLVCLLFGSLHANIWHSYVEGEGRYGDFRQGGGAHLFVPLAQNDTALFFSQSRFLRMKRQWTAGTGLGFRKLSNCCLAWGLNGFFDFSHSDTNHTYYQFTGGAELFGNCWEARINGYGPFRRERILEERTEITDPFLVDTEVFATFTFLERAERAYHGFDAEVGYCLPLCIGAVRGYAGYFYFHSQDARTLQGPHLRAYYEISEPFDRCGMRVFIGGEWQHDAVRRTQAAVTAGIYLPLGCRPTNGCCCCSPCSLCYRMGDLVHREYGVTLLTRTEILEQFTGPVIGPAGNVLQLIFFDQVGGGIGTQIDPTSLDNAIAISGPNDVLFGLADTGDITVTTTVGLQEDQQLLGFDDSDMVTVTFPFNIQLEVDDLTAAGRATLTRGVGDNIVTLADGNLIDGLRFVGGDDAINGSGINTVDVRDLLIEDPARGVGIDNSFGALSFEQVTISRPTDAGIEITNQDGSFSFLSGTIEDGVGADVNPIEIDTIENVTIVDSTIQNFTQLGPTPFGIIVDNGGGAVTIENNTLFNLDGPGAPGFMRISLDTAVCDVEINDNTITNPGGVSVGSAIFVDAVGGCSGIVEVNDNEINIDSLTGIVVQFSDAAGANARADINRNEITECTIGITLNVGGISDDSRIIYAIDENRVNTASDVGILVAQGTTNAATAGILNGTIVNNTLDTCNGGLFVLASASLGPDFLGATIQDNTLIDTTLTGMQLINSGAGRFGLTVLDNQDTSASASFAYLVQNDSMAPAAATMTTCATIMGNNTNRANGIEVERVAAANVGPLDVVRRDMLSADNNGISVNLVGTIGTVLSCPAAP